ncbi:hypothetical protein hmeg3_14795 [Herbaspirillum sp. meg3]|nr:hypothetical protein hmeg3_14795 [Herbaspirillum sp. meg3]
MPKEDNYMVEYIQSIVDRERSQLKKHSAQIEAFTAYALTQGIVLEAHHFSYFYTIGVIVSSPGITERLLENETRERDRLFSFDSLSRRYPSKAFGPGYFSVETFSFMAHSHFRRELGLCNSFAPHFIALFWGKANAHMTRYISLDADRIKLNIDDGHVVEADTWYGAPFNENIAEITSGVVKLRPPSTLTDSELQMHFSSAYCLDIKWSQEGNIKTFQALEMKIESYRLKRHDNKVYPARYLHAEFDIQQGTFRHFDGAMQYFTKDEYLLRRDSDFNYNAKSLSQIKTQSEKLFKINGEIERDEWSELCCHFFAGNPLIIEYFTGSYPQHTIETLERIDARNERKHQ